MEKRRWKVQFLRTREGRPWCSVPPAPISSAEVRPCHVSRVDTTFGARSTTVGTVLTLYDSLWDQEVLI